MILDILWCHLPLLTTVRYFKQLFTKKDEKSKFKMVNGYDPGNAMK